MRALLRSPSRGALSLRTVLLLPALVAGVYATGLSLYLTRGVGAAAAALEAARVVVYHLGDLTGRAVALEHALNVARELVTRPPPPDPAALRFLERLAADIATPAPMESFATVPDTVRRELVRSGEYLAELRSALTDVAALVAAGRRPAALARLHAADALHDQAHQSLAVAGRLAREDLLEREQALARATVGSQRVVAAWLVLGLLLTGLALVIARRRVDRPLADLDAGVARIADGDLTAQTPVHRADEIGRLAEHFNQMIRVLRDRAEEQGRFAAAGELLAGVAHEVNNPLMAIAAHAENRLAEPTITDEQRAEMTQILRQVRRATKLLRGLLRFLRATEPEVTRVNLNDVVRGALDLVSYRFGVDEITVGGRLDPSLPPVLGDAIKLEQVVVNLLSNAIDALRAIKPPRRLTVDTGGIEARVSVAVADNGRGVAPEVAARLFRPFATTKGRRGTGLGLYISRQIAREAGGDLTCVSAPGQGARFELSLPAAEALPDRPEVAPAVAAGATSGSGPAVASLAGLRVLIVDDEEAVRRPMAKFLARRGAQVEEAGDGEQALAQLHGQAPDVILADLRMPRMGGVALFAKLEDTRPDLANRVLFLSGDISQLAEPGNTPVARERVLVKPVELVVLERRILEFVRGGGR